MKRINSNLQIGYVVILTALLLLTGCTVEWQPNSMLSKEKIEEIDALADDTKQSTSRAKKVHESQ